MATVDDGAGPGPVDAAADGNSLRILLRMPVFRRMWGAITTSSFGDWLGLLATTALAAYLTKDTSSLAQGAAVSGVLLTRLAPDLILSPFAGALVDRFDRRKVAVIGDTTAGLLYLSIAFAGNLTWLLIAQFLAEAVGLFSTPAKQAIWVNIVPRERLAVANQINYVSIYGMVPVAAAAFAVLSTVVELFGSSPTDGTGTTEALIVGSTSTVAINLALVLNAATYFVAATIITVSRRMIPAFTEAQGKPRGVFSLVAEGIAFVSRNRVMRAIYIGVLGAFGAGGLVAGVAQAYVATLGGGNAGYGVLFGTVFSGLALGMLIGPKVLPTVSRRIVFTACIAASGLMLMVMALMPDFVAAAITSVVMGLFAGIAWITGFTMIGHEVSDRLRGRVFAFVMSSVRITLFITIGISPVLAGGIGSYRIAVGQIEYTFTAPALVLLFGGIIAFVIGLFTAHQISGGTAWASLRRVVRRAAGRLIPEPHRRAGVLIAVEGGDRQLVGRVRDLVGELATAAGAAVVVEPSAAGLTPIAGAAALPEPAQLVERLPVPEGMTQSDRPVVPSAALHAVAYLASAVGDRIRPAMEAGEVVVTSDYIDALVLAFGRDRKGGDEQIISTALWACGGLQPDLTIFVTDDAADCDTYREHVGTFSGSYLLIDGGADGIASGADGIASGADGIASGADGIASGADGIAADAGGIASDAGDGGVGGDAGAIADGATDGATEGASSIDTLARVTAAVTDLLAERVPLPEVGEVTEPVPEAEPR